ncbi:MAG: glycosyltransferase [Melioribacteraceae bacterium]|nr:glycosyltransferase [Melioribacteraceae bacterium]MCF8354535.1 glycosyltransferase [Melioribacteraceae bacterium]MCF8418204.1 glycosyltransferase [Melioribacteraceae bacterium]
MYPNSVVYRSGIFVHEQVKEILNLGYKVTVIAPIPKVVFPINLLNKRYSKYKKVPLFECYEGVDVYHPRFFAFPTGLLKQYWPYLYYILLKPLFRRILKNPQNFILHIHGGLPDDYGGVLLASYFKLPTLLTIHGASVYATLRKKSWFEKTKKAIESVDYVVAVSSVIKRRIQKYTDRKDNIITIHNGINLQDTINNKINNSITIITVSALIERKGIGYAISAFSNVNKKFNNLKYVIIGDGPLRKELELQAIQQDCSGKIKFFSFMPHDSVLKMISNSDIFLLTSWDEAFGVVYIEAMSLKIPVIATKNEGISDIIVDGENGFLANLKDVDDISNKLESLICDNKLRNQMGMNGYNSVKKLTWNKNATEYSKIYDHIFDIKISH